MSYDTTKPYTRKIFDLMRLTWKTPYVEVKEGIYPSFIKKFSYPEVDHTDGIGTKGVYHWRKRTFVNAVLDAMAMNLNDLALMGAIPYKLQNHIILPEDDENAILEIVSALSKECKARNIALTGGETSIHNNIEGLDLSITISGFLKKENKNYFQNGDILVGIKSTGLHSNGFTKVREIFKDKFYEDFIVPTRLYDKDACAIWDYTHGMMHITGGAFCKLKKLLGGLDAYIAQDEMLKPQEIFFKLYQHGIASEQMYKTFNCGVGFIISAIPEKVQEITAKLKDSAVIGWVQEGKGLVHIKSAFDGKKIIL